MRIGDAKGARKAARRRGWAVAALLASLAVAACAEENAAPAPVGIKTPGNVICTNQCRKSQDYCQQACDLDFRACYGDAQRAGDRAYELYAGAQYAARMPAGKSPADFQNTAPCVDEKNACVADCERHYNACYRSCVR